MKKTKLIPLIFLFIIPILSTGAFNGLIKNSPNALSIKPKSGFSLDKESKVPDVDDFKGLFTYSPLNLLGPFTNSTRLIELPIEITYKGSYYFNNCGLKLIYTHYYEEGDQFKYTQYKKTYSLTSDDKKYIDSFEIKNIDSHTYKTKIEYGLCYSSSSNFLDSISFEYYYSKNSSITAMDYSSRSYKPLTTRFYSDGSTYKEEYLFDRFSDILTVDRYYRLLIDELGFKYIGDQPFSYQSAYLIFFDRNNVFPYVNKDINGYCRLNIKFKYLDNHIYLDYADPMGVDTSSLQMYVPNQGMTTTNSFFVPKNATRAISNYRFEIGIKGAGVNLINIYQTFSIASDNFVIGNCNEDDYCIIGGVVQ